jgi:hypothetical protein
VEEPFGLARSTEGSILVSGSGGIYRVAAGGGRAQRVSAAAGALAMAPDGSLF